MRLNITHCRLWDCQYICIVIFYNVDVIRLVGRKLLWSWDKHKSWLSLSYLALRNKILLCLWPTRKQWVLNWSIELTNTYFFQICTRKCVLYFFYVVDLTCDAGWCVRFFQGRGVYWLVWSGGYCGFIMRGRGCLGLYALVLFNNYLRKCSYRSIFIQRKCLIQLSSELSIL